MTLAIGLLTSTSQVPVDCVFALLSLDYYHGCRYERGKDDNVAISGTLKMDIMESNSTARQSASVISGDDNNTQRRCSSNNAPERSVSSTRRSKARPVPLPTKPLRTYHPLHSSRISPRWKFYIQAAYDAMIIGLLITHIVNFFTSFPSNMRACRHASQEPLPDTDPLHAKLTIKQRCKRINIDIHVSGGFDIAISLVLLGLHVWHFVYRIWEVSMGCRDGAWDLEEEEAAMSGKYTIGRSLPDSQFLAYTRPKSSRAFSSSVAEEGRMGMDIGTRHSDWSKGKRRNTRNPSRTSSRGSGSESSKWSLLECLVP